jgi:dihydrofolate reductase
MRRIIGATFISLDGVMQAPGGPDEDTSGGFKNGGWTVPYWDDESDAFISAVFERPFDLLLGRRTYDIFASYWPNHVDNPIGARFDEVTKFVATSRPESLDWVHSVALGSDVPDELARIKDMDGPDLLVQGSSVLYQTLFTHDLLDELSLMVFPVVLGTGKRLFGAGAIPAAFELTDSKTTPSGVVMSRYRRAGDVKTGSFDELPVAEREPVGQRG